MSDAKIDKQTDNKLTKANSIFDRPYNGIRNNSHPGKDTKIIEHRAVVLITLLCSTESFGIPHHCLRFEWFQQLCVHILLNIHWSEFINGKLISIRISFSNAQLRWKKKHVTKMGRIIYFSLSLCRMNSLLVKVAEKYKKNTNAL